MTEEETAAFILRADLTKPLINVAISYNNRNERQVPLYLPNISPRNVTIKYGILNEKLSPRSILIDWDAAIRFVVLKPNGCLVITPAGSPTLYDGCPLFKCGRKWKGEPYPILCYKCQLYGFKVDYTRYHRYETCPFRFCNCPFCFFLNIIFKPFSLSV